MLSPDPNKSETLNDNINSEGATVVEGGGGTLDR